MQGMRPRVSYSPASGPRVIFGILAGSILVTFFWFVAAVWVPVIHGAYQGYRVERCIGQHDLAPGDFEPVFGFDYGGRIIVGDTAKRRSAIECIRSALDVSDREPWRDGDESTEAPRLEIGQSSFSHRLILAYYPANRSKDE